VVLIPGFLCTVKSKRESDPIFLKLHIDSLVICRYYLRITALRGLELSKSNIIRSLWLKSYNFLTKYISNYFWFHSLSSLNINISKPLGKYKLAHQFQCFAISHKNNFSSLVQHKKIATFLIFFCLLCTIFGKIPTLEVCSNCVTGSLCCFRNTRYFVEHTSSDI
jgi:hypothetical protein